ncbi:MAG: GMC family oxidoreductase [Alphaproteobacteria bacterium]|nr:GMC family oxidoreductase [Alphaproteobacteria bacterium]
MRYLGGGTNHWGGWTRPLDPIDFEQRDWMPYSGWPFGIETLKPYFPRAQALTECGTWSYDNADAQMDALLPMLKLGAGGVYTSWFQFSKTRNSELPTRFGQRYADDLKHIPNLKVYLHANATALHLSPNAQSLDSFDVATLNGHKFSVKPKRTVLAMGAIENARLMLASNDIAAAGIGNANDLVGRFFADHAIPRDTATLVTFSGQLAGYYFNPTPVNGAILRAALSPTQDFIRQKHVLGSLSTIEYPAEMDDLAKAAVTTTALALGVDASAARAFSVGCGLEVSPHPERRFTLSTERDALGLPRLKFTNHVADSDFESYNTTMRELGRQLLAAGTGMVRLNYHSRAEWEKSLDWGNHHMGTTRMHVDPKQGVVDANGRVHGMSNLYVAGSGVFPTYGSSNPTMNLVALTLRLADHLKATPT